MKQNTSVISIVAILLSIIALSISLIHVKPLDAQEGTYVGIMVTLLGISTTFLLGYQIFNAIEMTKKMKELEARYSESIIKNNELEKRVDKNKQEIAESLQIISAFTTYNGGQPFISSKNAFVIMHCALEYSLGYESTNIEDIFYQLRCYILEMNWQAFAGGLSQHEDGEYYINCLGPDLKKPFRSIIADYLNTIDETTQVLKNHPNYNRIKIEHQRILNLLKYRLDMMLKEPQRELTEDEKKQFLGVL